MRRRILWANGNFWTSPVKVGAHHYARLFAERGWDVAFVSDPISPFHFAKRRTLNETRERFWNWRRGGLSDLDGHVYHYTPFTLIPHFDLPLLRNHGVLNNWHHLTFPRLIPFLIRQGFDRPDLLVIDSVNQGFWLDALQPKQSLMRVVDDLSGFAGVTSAMIQRERELLGRVDVVAYTAKRMAARIEACKPRAMVHVPNGCDLAHFMGSDTSEPADLKSIPRPRALYVGAIDEWFDVDLIAYAAQALPQMSFVIVGPPRVPLDRIRRLANVYVLGRRPYTEIPCYMKNVDVGLIPFRITEMIRSVHPIKLYEYMSCGLPVVAVGWDELEALKSPARLCRSAQEFADAIKTCVDETVAPEARDARIEFASRANWRNRFATLTNALAIS